MNVIKVFLLICLAVLIPELSSAEKICRFEGQLDLTEKEFNIAVDLSDESSVTVKAIKTSETNYHFSLDIDHLKTPLFDLLSKIESSVDLVNGENGKDNPFNGAVQGKIWSQYSLVDYKPINELSGRFEIKDKRLHITALSVGNLSFEGYLDLVAPYRLDMAVDLTGVEMEDFLDFWGSGQEYESDGHVFGKIKASGSLEDLTLKGSLQSKDGFVQTLDYNSIVLNIEGIYPNMQIAESTITQSDGVSFSFNGPIDLRDKENFKKQIKALTLAPLIDDSGSELEWTLKRLESKDPEITETELKYQMKKKDALGTGPSTGDEIDMLGIERTRKF